MFLSGRHARYIECMFATSDWKTLLQVSQQATGQEVAGRDRLGVGQQEQPIRREAGDAESAHALPAGDAQSVSVTVHIGSKDAMWSQEESARIRRLFSELESSADSAKSFTSSHCYFGFLLIQQSN